MIKKNRYIGLLAISVLFSSWAQADITGKIFRDFDANGQQTLAETGVTNVIINGSDSSGGTCTTTSSNEGTYTLSGCSGATRVIFDFSALPFFYEGANGAESDTNVRFANDGDSAVDFALQNPAEYCHADPYISSAHYWGMIATGGESSLETFPYSAGVTAPSAEVYKATSWQDVPPITIATNDQIGSTFGNVWDRSNNYLYVSAFKGQYVPFGSGGRGQIYRIAMNPVTGQATGVLEEWVNVETDLSRTVCGSPASLTYSDALFDEVGKCSLGDLEISDDDMSLYVTNIGAKEIVQISTATGIMESVIDFPLNATDCASSIADIYPFGLAHKDGKLYAGGVCTAETSQNVADINVFVYRLDDPITLSWTKVIEFHPETEVRTTPNVGTQWKTWVSSYAGNLSNGYYDGREQVMLTDIEFYGDDMILGLRDRAGDQVADGVVIDGNTVNGVAARGDVVCAAYSSATDRYTLETTNPNACGGRVASGTGLGDANGEFYWGDGSSSSGHEETAMGNLAVFGGSYLLMGAVNPAYALGSSTANSGGILWLDNQNGAAIRTYYQYDGNGNTNSKGNGLGDIEALCNPAPLEIGNRVWEDTDNDGEQDAGEAAIAGVAVTLTCGAQTASTTTDANGRYLFKDGSADIATWTNGIIPRNSHCEVSISESDAALGGKTLTSTDQANGNDVVDSDGILSAGRALKTFSTGRAGQNNHSYDFGFRDAAVPPPATGCVTLTNTVTVSATESDSNTSDNTASADLQVNCVSTPSVDLALTKTVSNTNVVSGDTTAYTLTVSNAGPDAATGVAVTDQLPAGVTYSTHNASQGTYDNNTGVWTVGDLANGANATLTIDVRVD